MHVALAITKLQKRMISTALCVFPPLMRPPDLLELRRAHEGTAEGVVEVEEDGVKVPQAAIAGKPRVDEW